MQKFPRWKSIRDLESKESNEFQEIVKKIAKSEDVLPVHLDIKWWSE